MYKVLEKMSLVKNYHKNTIVYKTIKKYNFILYDFMIFLIKASIIKNDLNWFSTL